MNRISEWKRGVATSVDLFANDSGGAFFRYFLVAIWRDIS